MTSWARFVLLVPAILAGCATIAERAPVWDSHVHLNDVQMQLALMEEYGIERAVVFWGRRSDNSTVLEAAARYPTRLIPFASISPERSAFRAQWQRDDPAIVAELERLLATGLFRGIGEISVVHAESAGFAATDFDPESGVMRGLMSLARRYRLPVMVHCEVTRLPEFESLLRSYPDVAVIWAHGGYTGAAEARRMLGTHANLYYELSARTWPRHPRSADYPIMSDGEADPAWLALVESMPARFLVGTDASHHAEANERMKFGSVLDFLGKLSPGARRQVGSGTLRRLLGEGP